MKIFAVDPGFGRVGFALVKKEVPKNIVIFSECFITSKQQPLPQRMNAVNERFNHLLDLFQPKVVALEKLFFSKNKKTAMRVAEVRGMLIATTINRGLILEEYTPKQIKNSITGFGNADKKQIIKMLPHFVSLEKSKGGLDDEYDAIALAVTCIQNNIYEGLLKESVE